jgi:general secretion pathway protein D
MQKLVSSKLKKSVLALSFASLLVGSVSTLEAKSCDSRTFNIKIAEEVSTNEILNQLSDECGFSVIAKDEVAGEKLSKKLFGINIKKMGLDEIFEVLVTTKGLDYDYSNNMLQISGLTTRTFQVDYVNTERAGVSNTDISLTGDSAAAEGEGAKGGSLSTGATITSNDKFSFWAKMEKELGSILNSPSDKFKAPSPIINREAGLVTVSGTTTQVNRVSTYIDQLMSRLQKQVLIDVKILSVNLDNSRQTGINWGEIYKLQNVKLQYELLNTNNLSTVADTISEFGDQNPSAHATFMRLSGNTQITDLVKFLHTQGDVTSISNPKVVTLSNQPAVFSSGDQLYYKLSASSRQSGTNAATETFNNEVVKSVFAGILLDITPQITDDGEIILKINPSISTVKNQVKTDESGVRRLPPDLMKKQISSVVKLRDGEKIVLGGLISSRKGNTTYKVPILGNLPVLGHAFRQEKISEIREELVVIITPHIINPKRGARKVVSLKELGYQGIQ